MGVALLILVVFSAGALQENGGRLFGRALEQFQGGDFEEARKQCERYLRRYPRGRNAPRAAFIIGESYFRTKSFTAAVEAFGRAYESYGGSAAAAEILEGLGRTKLQLGLVQEALVHFEEALRKSPPPDLLLKLNAHMAEIHYENGEYDDAKKAYLRLVELLQEPDARHSARLRLADCYYRVRDFEEARDLFVLFLSQDPKLLDNAPEMAFRWGELLLFTGDLDGARRLFLTMQTHYSGHAISPHVTMRLGDLERRASLRSEDSAVREKLLRKAVGYYRRLLLVNDLEWNVSDQPTRILAGSAALRILEAADLGGVDLEGGYGLPPAKELLARLLQGRASTETKALALLHVARHYLVLGREKEALESYKRLIRDFAGTELVPVARGEHSQLTRAYMEKSYGRGDFDSFINTYLEHGQELALSIDDKIRLAEAYARMQIYDRAEALFRELSGQRARLGIRRQAALGLARLEVNSGDRAIALRRLREFLETDPPPEDREKAVLLILDAHFYERNLSALRAYRDRRSGELNTPQLRATAMFKLAMLSKINGLMDEATELFERLLLEFGGGIPGSERVHGYLADTQLALGDLYFNRGQWRMAAGRYELFIALHGGARELAWPLFQSANCHRWLGELELAADIYRELIRLYPKSAWSSQAQVTLDELKPEAGAGGER